MNDTELKRFLSKFEMRNNNVCWIWHGTIGSRGYGQFCRSNGRIVQAHRTSYEIFIGKCPANLEPDHLCRVRHCINPWHLQWVTHAENVRRGIAADMKRAITHCPKGHPYNKENTIINVGTGKHRTSISRQCRICNRRNTLAWYHRKQNEKVKA